MEQLLHLGLFVFLAKEGDHEQEQHGRSDCVLFNFESLNQLEGKLVEFLAQPVLVKLKSDPINQSNRQ